MGHGRVLAVDPGSRRIGLAVSDPEGTVALPLGVVPAGFDLVARIGEIAQEHEVIEIVVGLPLRLDGSEGPAAHDARRLAGRLEEELPVKVSLVDERLTTAAAGRALDEGEVTGRKRRGIVDQVAAALLLQGYLDAQRSS